MEIGMGMALHSALRVEKRCSVRFSLVIVPALVIGGVVFILITSAAFPHPSIVCFGLLTLMMTNSHPGLTLNCLRYYSSHTQRTYSRSTS